MDMSGKTAIVCGGGRDIGRACVMRLAEAGAKVAINYHNSGDGADIAVEEITAAGGSAFALQGDMTNEADVAALVDKTKGTFGRLDSVVHVTGGLVARKTIAEMSMEHWQTVMSLNVTSLVLVLKAALPEMTSGGSIVTFASQAGRDGGGPGSVAYAASKGAVMTMTRGLAKELGPDIRINAICPGMIDTDFHNIFTADDVRKKVAGSVPLRREGTSEDIGNLATYLASDASAYITGASIDINGGALFS